MAFLIINLAVLLPGLLAVVLIGLNWYVLVSQIWNTTNKKVSLVYLVPQILLYMSAMLSAAHEAGYVPRITFLILALLDPAFWQIAVAPFVAAFHRLVSYARGEA